MFDLNEAPDLPSVEAGVEGSAKPIAAAPSCIPISVVSNGTPEEISMSSLSAPLPSSSSKVGHNFSTEEAASVVENPLLKGPLPSSLSSEVASTTQFNDSSQQPVAGTEGIVDTANATESLGLSLRDEPLHSKQSASYKIDSSNDGSKLALPFFVRSLGDATTSLHPEQLERATSVHELDNVPAGTILSISNEIDLVRASEMSSLRLSLGGIYRKPLMRDDSCNPIPTTSKAKVSYASDLSKPQISALRPRKSPDLSPFWRGKLCTSDASMQSPTVAYCLGIMTSDSRLTKLPSVLAPKKYLKLEELEKTVCKGLAEPLMQIKPSCEASSDEIRVFSSWVKALSCGSESSRSPSLSSSFAQKHNLLADGRSTTAAAVISWDGDSSDAELLLISLPSMQAVLKVSRFSSFVDTPEDIDWLDPESLYGMFCHGTSGARTQDGSTHLERTGKTGLHKHSEKSMEGSVVANEKEREMKANVSHRECSVTRPEFLSKSVSLQPIRSPGRDDCNFESEEVVRVLKRRYEKQLSSSDRVREATSKHNSRNSVIRNFEEDDKGHRGNEQGHFKQREKVGDSALQSSRQEWRSDRLKDNHRRNKDDKNISKQKIKEHYRHREQEKDKPARSHGTGEHHHDQDKLHSRERDRLVKENIVEVCGLRSSTEKHNSGSKSKAHRSNPDNESSRLSRKRDRDDNKERTVSGKRHRELGVDNDSRQLKDLACESKPNVGAVEHTHIRSLEQENGSMQGSNSPKPCNLFSTLDTLHGTSDSRVSVMDMDAHALDASSAVPEEGHGTLDDALNVSKELFENPVSLLNIRSSIPLRIFAERSEQVEDRPSADFLSNSMVDKGNEEKDTSLEFILDVSDKETRTWLLSKQSISYLEEEYGVRVTMISDHTNTDVDAKIDPQTGPIIVRIFGKPLVPCDAAEDKWFLEQASATIKSIALRGVFIKCFWYEGPVQIHPGDGAPSVSTIVKKIKGDDGKNLDRIQDLTGVMIGVVLRKCGSGTASQEIELLSRPRFIGLRLKCVRRRGLLDASKEAEALLESVADHFSKELATHIATHIVDLQALVVHPSEDTSNQSSPLVPGIATRELLPNLPVKDESSPCLCKGNEVAVSASVLRIDGKILIPKEALEGDQSTASGAAARSLYVTNLPDHSTPIKIQNIFENVLRQKLEPWTDIDHMSDLVVDVILRPESSCAFILLANDVLLNASVDLYEEDSSVFQGMKIELGPRERQGTSTRNGLRFSDFINRLNDRTATSAKREEGGRLRRQEVVDNDYDSECSEDKWVAENLTVRADPYPGRPRPLFLSELMRNASAPVIKQLFEDIITSYIGPNLIGAGGRQLVLDVRYVPSRGCAFVDLATPELADFMLDLHSRRPDVFKNMKMELGRKPVPYAVEEDSGGRLNLRLHGKSHFSSQTFGYRLSLASRKKLDKRANGSFDVEDSDKGDDSQWLSSRTKKQRSDPEKTIYVDRLPENASEGTIKKIFERVLLQKVAREEMEAVGDDLITEVRHVPSKYCAFVVFATEDLTRIVLQLYNQYEEIFESMRLKPHFHSRMEDLYKDELQEEDEIIQTSSLRERMESLDSDNVRLRQLDAYDCRTRSAAHRAITASAFREVDRRRSVYVDRIPEDLSEATMTDMFEKAFHFKKHGHDGHMVSQVAYFRDKFDPSKLCAFVEVKTESGTQALVDYYNSNPDAFRGMRVRPGFKYHS